jgi:uncharacterized surface protein with fasciclin (FAS1) repeats
MLIRSVLVSCAIAALSVGAAHAQSTATATTEAQAKAATGKATTDKPADTAVQGTAKAVQEGVAAAPAADTAAKNVQAVVASGDLVETLKASGQFKTLLSAVDATNLTAVLKNNKNLTLFAPTDAAFAALPAGELDKLMADKAALQKLVLHHLINAPIDTTHFNGTKKPFPSVAADLITLDGSVEGALKADNATIVQANVKAANGNLHVVDRVLKALPPEAQAAAAPAAN